MIASDTAPESPLTDAELESLRAAARGSGSGRAGVRHPFFTNVTLRSTQNPAEPVSAFSRELADSGIGLLHASPLRSGEVFEIDIRIEDLRVCKKGRVGWCRPVAAGWFLSGCAFV
jgi:hypothetical protein